MLRFYVLLGILLSHGSAYGFEWSSTQLEWLHGTTFHEPANPKSVTKDILTFQHADGHAYGRNFLFVDLLQSNRIDQNATEVYAEGYSSLSLNKLSDSPAFSGIIRDVNLTLGINYGRKVYAAYTVNPRVLLSGITFDFNVPGFNFLNVDMLAYIDRGLFAGQDNGCHATGWQITPAWEVPLTAGGESFVFEGFADIIGQHGSCTQQVLSQPRLRWNLGRHFGIADQLYLGIEYQYWQNKFGIRNLNDRVVQSLLMWKF